MPALVAAIVLHPKDRAELVWRVTHYGAAGGYRKRPEPEESEGPQWPLMATGIELRRSEWMPEGTAALLDRQGNFLGTIPIGGDD